MSTRRNLGEKTGISRNTPTRIRGLAVWCWCLTEGLAGGDQLRPKGSDSALEVCYT